MPCLRGWLSRRKQQKNPSSPSFAPKLYVFPKPKNGNEGSSFDASLSSGNGIIEQNEDEPPEVLMTESERAERIQKVKDPLMEKGLWTEARKRLDPEQVRQLESFIDDHKEGLYRATKNKLEAVRKSRLKIKIGKGKVVPVRDGVRKVIETILSYDSIISVAVAAEPHSRLAWGCVAALLPILSTALSRTDKALDHLNKISIFLVQFRAIEVVYDLSENPEEKFKNSKHIQDLHSQLRSQTIDIYAQVLQFQISLVQHYSHNKLGRLLEDISCPAQEGFPVIRKLIANANSTLQTMDSVTITDVDKRLSSLVENVKEMMDEMTEVHTNVLDLSKAQCIMELPRATYSAFDEGIDGQIPPSCYRDTRKEVLDIIRHWGKGGGENRVFWLSGMAGCGKSTVARTIASDFNESGHLGASFFFSRGQEDRAKTEKFFTTLARSLAQTISGFDECLYHSIPKYENVQHKSLKFQWDALIFRPLQALASTLLVPLSLVIVIDALDECRGIDAVPDIIRLFLEAEDLRRIQLRILVTSRNEKHIVESLSEKLNVTHLSLEDGSGASSTERDISLYVKDKLSVISRNPTLKESQWPEEKSAHDLLRWCGSLFIAAATACRFLEKSEFPDEALEHFLSAKRTNSDGADSLDDMYLHLLKSAASGSDSEKFITHFPVVMGAILVSKEPMSVSDMAIFLGLEPRVITFILNRLRSVLTISQDMNSPVGLFHLSFRDFLVDRTRCSDKRFFIDENEAHYRSFTRSRGLLASRLKRDICGLGDPGMLISEIDSGTISPHIPDVVRYCAQYWAFHLADSGVRFSGTEEIGQALLFLHQHGLYWLEALSLLGKIDYAIDGIAKLKSLAAGSGDQGVDNILDDAYRFILYHRSTIELAPLQVYYMATIFTPTDSPMHNVNYYFQDYRPPGLSKSPSMPSRWGSEEQSFAIDSKNGIFAISSEDKMVACSTQDTVIVSSATTGRLNHTLETGFPDGQVKYMMFYPDGRELHAILQPSRTNDQQALKSWSLVTGKVILSLQETQCDLLSAFKLSNWSYEPGHTTRQKREHPLSEEELPCHHEPSSVSLSDDWKMMAFYDWNSALVHIGKTETKQISHTLVFQQNIRRVVTSATKVAIQLAGEGGLKVWDMINDHEIEIEDFQKDEIETFTLSADGTHLVYANNDSIKMWDLAAKQMVYSVEHAIEHAYAYSIERLALFPDKERVLISSSSESYAHIWDLRQPHSPYKPFLPCQSVAATADGTKMVSCQDGVLAFWDLIKEQSIMSVQTKDYEQLSAFDGTYVARVGEDTEGDGDTRGFQVWTLKTKKEELATHGAFVPTNMTDALFLVVSPEGTRIAIFSFSNYLEIWDYSESTCQWHLHQADQYEPVEWATGFHADFSHNGTRLVISQQTLDSCHLSVWCIESGEIEFYKTHNIPDDCLGFINATLSRCSTVLAISLLGSPQNSVDIWENRKDPQRKMQIHHDHLPSCMEFSPRGTRIAIGWSNTTVSIHNLATGQTEWKFEAWPPLAMMLKFSSDDSWDKEDFYTPDHSGQWILYGGERLLAIPRQFQKGTWSPGYKSIVQHERSNSIAYIADSGRPVAIAFDDTPR